MGTGRRGASLERQVTITIVAAALIAAIAASGAIGWMHTVRARSDSEGNAVVDAMSAAIGKGAEPRTIVDSFAAAGTIRSATIYGADGSLRARNGVASPKAELVCRDLVGGGSICIEPRTATRAVMRDTLRSGAIALGVSLLAATALAAIAVRVIRRRVRGIRVTIDEAIRDQT